MRKIRTYHEVAMPGDEDVVAQVVDQRRRLAARLAPVARVIAVGSGKGGVGKSAVAANLAAALAARGLAVGALDADLDGPSLARMLGVAEPPRTGPEGLLPVRGAGGVRVVGLDLLLDSETAPVRWTGPAEDAHLWRGLVESGALRELLADVAWGPLDALVVDLPPGAAAIDRLAALLPRLDLLLLVTTPSEAARRVVARSVEAARGSRAGAVALVANMARWSCPECGHTGALWPSDGARALAEATGLPVWADVPFEPGFAAATDGGTPPAGAGGGGTGSAAAALAALAERVAAIPARAAGAA